jgi:hypothetical protein
MFLTNKCSHKRRGIKMKIVNVKKFLRSILLIIGLIAILLLLLGNSSLSHRTTEFVTIYVAQGDTLWGIASELQKDNEYYKGRDVRYIVNHLMSTNSLSTNTLAVNQPLQIPTI